MSRHENRHDDADHGFAEGHAFVDEAAHALHRADVVRGQEEDPR